MNFTYVIILAVVLIVSPFILKLASNQGKKTKQNLKSLFIFILSAQILLGFFNWETLKGVGRSGFELSLAYPASFLGLFFIISSIQIIFLIVNKSFNTLAVALNFINSVLIFLGLIRLSNILEVQAVSIFSVGAVFLALTGNIISLSYINKDKKLLKKYPFSKGFSFIPLLIITTVIALGVILDLQREDSILLEKLAEVSSTKISSQLAVENVKKLPEVQEYLKNVPNGKIEVDNELEGEYNVHVYEVKDGHTATFNWYRVSIKSGEVRSEFPIEQNQEQSSQQPTGTVSGKICYPSEVIPKGKLEVKRLMDDDITYEDYPGSNEGVKPTYSFQLGPGDYYIRYNVDDKIFGYSTTVCPTGNETTCADTKKRIPVMAVVKTDQELKNYDLCDYFYKDSNAPKF